MKPDTAEELHPTLKHILAFSKEHYSDVMPEGRASNRFSRSDWDKICSSGILGIAMPEKYGGREEGLLVAAQAVRTLSRYCGNEGLILSLCAHLCTCMVPIMCFGTDEQKERFLPKLITGELIGGNGTTELKSGSDLSRMQTSVYEQNDFYIVNGVKNFVTNGSIADLLIVYGSGASELEFANTYALIAEKGSHGISVVKDWDTLGLETSPLTEIRFSDCKIATGNLLGRKRLGMVVFNESMFWERIIMSAYMLGSMELQFNFTLRHCRNREQFQKKIIDFQGVSYRLVDLKRTIETSSALLQQVCLKHANKMATAADAALLKLHASEGKVSNSVQAISLFGALGYTKDLPIETQLRNSIAAPTYSGTSDVQKMIIANDLEEYG